MTGTDYLRAGKSCYDGAKGGGRERERGPKAGGAPAKPAEPSVGATAQESPFWRGRPLGVTPVVSDKSQSSTGPQGTATPGPTGRLNEKSEQVDATAQVLRGLKPTRFTAALATL